MRNLLLAILLLSSSSAWADSMMALQPQASVVSSFNKFLLNPFGALRVSTPKTVFDFKRLYGVTGVYFQSVTFGAGAYVSHDADWASTTLCAGTVSGGYAISQTRTYWNYQPGKGIRLLMTGNFFSNVTGTVKRMGIFDANNGLFFQYDSNGLAVGQRSNTSGSPVDTVVYSNNFNWGRGLSLTANTTLNPAMGNIFFIEQEWLGMGDVWMGVIVDGQYFYLHQFNNANRNRGVYTKTASLPLRAEVRNTGTPPSTSVLSSVCWALEAEGGYAPSGKTFAQVSDYPTAVAVNSGSFSVLFAIRNNSTWARSNLKALEYSALQNTTNANAEVQLWLCQGGAGISGTTPVWRAVDNGRSVVEWSKTQFTLTTTTAGVMCVSAMLLSGVDKVSSGVSDSDFLFAGADYDGNRDVYVITAKAYSANASFVSAAMSWLEIY